jgi:hypothetical protein
MIFFYKKTSSCGLILTHNSARDPYLTHTWWWTSENTRHWFRITTTKQPCVAFESFERTSLERFTAYFEKQWIKSKFNKWQIFWTPAGYAHSNSPIESYNTKKMKFTVRVKYHMIPAITKFQEFFLVNFILKIIIF